MRILLDTSSILLMVSKKKDIISALEEYNDEKKEYYITSSVIEELTGKTKGNSITANNARTSLGIIVGLIEQKRLKRIVEPPSQELSVDDMLIRKAMGMDAVILTQDKELKRKAKSIGVGTITYKKRGVIGD
ncbi:MAG: PIN domain-containing protein [Candidatus Woesearchaeota archaeon]